jgi:hypothetical protein
MRTPRKSGRVWMWIGVVALGLLVASIFAVRFVISHAEPIIHARVIQTLSTRFHSKVELAGLAVAIDGGIEVTGNGLKIFGATDPNPYEPGFQPLINLRQFRFQTSLRSLFRSPMHIDTVYVDGLELNLPPKESRQDVRSLRSRTRVSIFVDKFVCRDTKLLINTSKPGRPPLEFDISELNLKDFGPGQAFQFEATLVNPKPVGDIHSNGMFGPWRPDSPRETPVKGDYSFTNADLSTIKGIAGMLSSTGQYSGMLGSIEVQGSTNTPDFRIASSGHSVPLHTDFHAIVDGTSGDTYLQPVNATFLATALTARGSVVRMKTTHGHDVELEVTLEHAGIEDLLQLGVRTEPPIMTGPVEMNTRLSLPPGEKSVADRLKLSGTFHVPRTHFTNAKVQGRLDSLSMISQGKPKEAREHLDENVSADLRGTFALSDGALSFSSLHFLIPGTHVDLSGIYSLDGETFDFHGQAMLAAKLSQMTTGWKSILLKPVDPFFRKGAAGTEIPIRVTGTQSEPHFGLDFGHKEQPENPKKTDTVSQRR